MNKCNLCNQYGKIRYRHLITRDEAIGMQNTSTGYYMDSVGTEVTREKFCECEFGQHQRQKLREWASEPDMFCLARRGW